MRHGNKVNHLGRTVTHRRALLKNLAIALITHKRIETTLAKAKSLRRFIEPLITKSRENTTHSRRVVFSYLQSKDAALSQEHRTSLRDAITLFKQHINLTKHAKN